MNPALHEWLWPRFWCLTPGNTWWSSSSTSLLIIRWTLTSNKHFLSCVRHLFSKMPTCTLWVFLVKIHCKVMWYLGRWEERTYTKSVWSENQQWKRLQTLSHLHFFIFFFFSCNLSNWLSPPTWVTLKEECLSLPSQMLHSVMLKKWNLFDVLSTRSLLVPPDDLTDM